jgi:membrane-bound lytic murein transglycosylase A
MMVMNILVVDSVHFDRERTLRALKNTQHNLIKAESNEDALEHLKNSAVDMILIGCLNQGCAGMSLLYEIRMLSKQIQLPIIMLSKSEDASLISTALKAGAQDFIFKSDISEKRLWLALLNAKTRYELERQQDNTFKKLKYLSETDALTGLSNRYFFESSLSRSVANAARGRYPLELMLIDLDDFKVVNDTYGHDIGDDFIRQVTQRIQSCLRDGEILARLGGDEFGLILNTEKGKHSAARVATRILEKLEQPISLSGRVKERVSASIGISVFPEDATTPDLLIKQADVAMYRAKRQGKHKFSYYRPEQQQKTTARVEMENALKSAIMDDSLQLYFQPVMRSGQQGVWGVEALIRWKRNNVLMLPDTFMENLMTQRRLPTLLKTGTLCLFAVLAGCSTKQPITPTAQPPVEQPKADTQEPTQPEIPQAVSGQAGISHPVCWSHLPGWPDQRANEAIASFNSQCQRMIKSGQNKAAWQSFCSALQTSQSSAQTTRLIEQSFTPYQVLGKHGETSGLITGYYESTLQGSFQKSARYRYPLYKKPDDLLIIDLGDRFPELKGERVRGRLVGNKVVRYYDREAISKNPSPLAGNELIWVDDPDDAFFLEIQGSGRVKLDNGQWVGVGYADQNGEPYYAIGRELIKKGILTPETVSLQTIRQWLSDNPKQANKLKNLNRSYVFFTLRDVAEDNPRGSLNVPLTPERSVAVDRSVIPLGTPLWISTTLPNRQTYQRLVLAQDTGGAIRGPVRADLFFGRGDYAEKMAGEMKQSGQIYALMIKGSKKVADTQSCPR